MAQKLFDERTAATSEPVTPYTPITPNTATKATAHFSFDQISLEEDYTNHQTHLLR